MPTKLKRPTAAEDEAIRRGVATDPDNPEWTDEDFHRARPAREALGSEVVDALEAKRIRGRQKTPTKTLVSIRLDGDVLEALRATGPGWQGRANDLLRKAVKV